MKDSYHHGNLKHDLIEAAIGVISNNGFDALSLRGVSTLCGVSHNAVYRHFDSKEQLIAACRKYVTECVMDRLNDAIDSIESSSEETLRRLSAAYISFYQQHPTYYSALYRNADAKLIFSAEEANGNYPPLELFRKVCSACGSGNGWTPEETLRRLIRLWALINGLTALVISANTDWERNWQEYLDTIIE